MADKILANPDVRTVKPECLTKDSPTFALAPLEPAADRITPAEYQVAKRVLIDTSPVGFHKYLRSRRDIDIPRDQKYQVFTFIPAPLAVPDKDGVYGIVKQRGNYKDIDEATEHAEGILMYDTYSRNNIAETGVDVPLVAHDYYTQEFYNIKDEKEDTKRLAGKVDEINRAQLEKARKKEMENAAELKEREKQVKTEAKEPGFPEGSIDEYLSFRCSRGQVLKQVEMYDAQRADFLKKAEEIEVKINALDAKYPDYRDKAKAILLKRFSDAGVDEDKNPYLPYL